MQSWGKDPGETLGPGRYRRRAAREASSYCQWALSGTPGIRGQRNGPSRANEDPRSL